MAKKDPYREFLKEDFGQIFKEMELGARQEHFMKSRWLDQMLWLDKKATQCRDRYYQLRLTAIVLGVVVPIMVGIDLGDNRTLERVKQYLTIGLSAVVAVSAAVEEFYHYGERWNHYRRTAESLKTQIWQYHSLTGPYKKFATHRDGFKNFAARVEDVIQKDVEVYVTQLSKADEEKEEQEAAEPAAAVPAGGQTSPTTASTATTTAETSPHSDQVNS